MFRLSAALFAGFVVLPMSACATPAGVANASATPGASARATIIDARGSDIGYATLEQTATGVLIYVKVSGLTPGPHGLHIHDHAVCEPGDRFLSAKGHVGKADGAHGFRNPAGPEAGDLPNLFVGADGEGRGEFFTDLVSFDGSRGLALFDEDGSSLLIHENADDHLTQPIGGAGSRIACGIIRYDRSSHGQHG